MAAKTGRLPGTIHPATSQAAIVAAAAFRICKSGSRFDARNAVAIDMAPR